MTSPVTLTVERPARQVRLHVAIRLVLLVALGLLGTSSVYWILYLTAPAVVALIVNQKGGDRYLAEHAGHLVRVLRWLAAAYAYLWLLTDAPPTSEANGPVELQVATSGTPTAGSALWRLVYSLPALLLLALISFVACLLWLVGAIALLVRQQLPAAIAHFLSLTLRYQFRLIAYHLSLVDRYPSFEEVSAAPAPQTGGAP
jgi:hypothetical protein